MVFIRDVLSKVDYKDKAILKLVEMATSGSKLAILTRNGELITTGNWVKKYGVYFSNSSYEKSVINTWENAFKKNWQDWNKKDWSDGYKTDKGYIKENALYCQACGGDFTEDDMGLDYCCPICKSEYIQYTTEY